MDLFEQSSAFYDVVVLQVVLEELRNRSLPLYNRLIGLTKSEDKRFYVFFNEFRLETHVARREGESVNDRNDRAVRKAVAWYGQHLARTAAKKVPAVVMLSNDRANLQKAKQEGIPACSLAEYVKQLKDGEKLLDMLPETEDLEIKDKRPGEPLYPEYFSMSKMMTGVKNGLLHQGIFNVSPYNYLEGSIRVPAFPKPLSSSSRCCLKSSGRSPRPG
jgi:exosome complex exonuclease DIS3/RRP44